MNNQIPKLHIKAIIGLGNPGPMYCKTRHNIGFLIVDSLADHYQGHWQSKNNMEFCTISIENNTIMLIKPTTFMNNSGQVISWLSKQGVQQENILVAHDELELPFGVIKLKFDGSAKGHNGLKSIMAHGGSNFLRLRFGIDRPVNKQDVSDYVLGKFKEPNDQLEEKIDHAVQVILDYISA